MQETPGQTRLCDSCATELPPPRATGRPRRFCSQLCRQRDYLSRAWVRDVSPPSSADPCGVCGDELGPRYELDHIIPVSKFGSGDPDNLQWVHPWCNKSKGTRILVPHLVWTCPACGQERGTDLQVTALAHSCPANGGRPVSLVIQTASVTR